jgi:hypothetical protein
MQLLQTSQSQSQSYVSTDSQEASLSCCQAPMWGLRPEFYYCRTVAGLLMWGALSDERMGLPSTIAAGPRQRSHSRVRVPRGSIPYVTVSDSRLSQPGGPGPLIYIPQEKGGPVIPPGTRFPFRRLVRLAGLRWRYSNPPPRGMPTFLSLHVEYLILHGPHRKHRVQQFFYCFMCIRWRRNVFTEPLHGNIRLFWLHCSGFQALGGTHRQQSNLISFLLVLKIRKVG